LPSETMIWQPEFTDKTLSRKPGAVHTPSELAKKLNIPAFDAGVFICDHQNILKYHRNRL
ncbi:hypothetical protein OSK88_23975, partial [Escherichia coli]|nr:hypothetical protein [Escherichia coli]MDA6264684.1 hypothetical protein [Escherichia coli]MDA6528155.1 hypothetical protein [Escherichia coli]